MCVCALKAVNIPFHLTTSFNNHSRIMRAINVNQNNLKQCFTFIIKLHQEYIINLLDEKNVTYDSLTNGKQITA